MSQCPKCGTSLKEDYGMVTCPSCGAILFVDMEGVAHMGADPEPASAVEPMAPPSVETAQPDAFPFPEIPAFGNDMTPAQPEAASAQEWASPTEESSSSAQSFAESEAFEIQIEPSDVAEPAMSQASQEPPAVPEQDFSMDAFLGYGDPSAAGDASAPLTTEPLPPDFGPAGDPLGLNGYANSEISQAKDGLLVFRVFLAGIDTKEIRESLREAINDSRFGWDIAEILGRIEKGHLTIDNVSPVKASILINRIKKLPIRIRWEQYAITQVENP